MKLGAVYYCGTLIIWASRNVRYYIPYSGYAERLRVKK